MPLNYIRSADNPRVLIPTGSRFEPDDGGKFYLGQRVKIKYPDPDVLLPRESAYETGDEAEYTGDGMFRFDRDNEAHYVEKHNQLSFFKALEELPDMQITEKKISLDKKKIYRVRSTKRRSWLVTADSKKEARQIAREFIDKPKLIKKIEEVRPDKNFKTYPVKIKTYGHDVKLVTLRPQHEVDIENRTRREREQHEEMIQIERERVLARNTANQRLREELLSQANAVVRVVDNDPVIISNFTGGINAISNSSVDESINSSLEEISRINNENPF